MYLSEKETRKLLRLLVERINMAEYAHVPALTTIDSASSAFIHFGTQWDVGQIFSASRLPWKKFESFYKEERDVINND